MIYHVELPRLGGFEAWRDAARRAARHGIAPQDITWGPPPGGLFTAPPLPEAGTADRADLPPRQIKVPAQFVKLARSVCWHKAPERYDLLYQALWRLTAGVGDPLCQSDPLGRRLQLMAKAVGRDIHKMHAFVRFRELPDRNGRRNFGAWFEPDHFITEPASTFFVKRFTDMDWTISTPDQTARFMAGRLSLHEGGPRPDLPEDASAQLWGTYFANIFNPARVKLNAMRAEMPRKYWKNLPETALIPDMLRDAEARVTRMMEAAASPARPGSAKISARYRATMGEHGNTALAKSIEGNDIKA